MSTKTRRGAVAGEGKTHARAARPTGAPKSPSAQAASRTNALDAAPDARRARQPGTLLSQESHPQGLRSFPSLPAHLDATPGARVHDGPPGPRPTRQKIIGRGNTRSHRGRILPARFRRAMRAFAPLEEPARQHGASIFFDPLVQQTADLLSEVGGMIQAREFIALQRKRRSRQQKLPRRLGYNFGQLTS